MSRLGYTLLYFAAALVLHAAYSTYEYNSRRKAMGRPEGAMPTDIVAEAFLALIIGTLGASLHVPPLQEITWASEMSKRSIDGFDSRLGFANYMNRGRSFFAPR
ncbi:hypothetical protein FISHEDRAFT_36188 [Fistulina hepatica ATCC 64428]|uniref:Membrane magnesium transporter n=1 Tax=Fistulina hepatica ATCC 64428 TaxID=1128425 RepID=A0A0D7AJ12_9AGAR|nr:hypothetical protein FISHEDRAFT_36188 [Fistulina hepatica ATCC 64428]